MSRQRVTFLAQKEAMWLTGRPRMCRATVSSTTELTSTKRSFERLRKQFLCQHTLITELEVRFLHGAHHLSVIEELPQNKLLKT
jgi:hypothetical protein